MNIAIIKLGALGDVVRTLSILPAIKEKYPSSKISWITKSNAIELFNGNPYISKAISFSNQINEKFDILYNFDIDKEATSLAIRIPAEKKLGFYSEGEYPLAFNPGAEYYLNTIFDDNLKRENKKTYQEMMFQAADLKYKKQPSQIFLSEKNVSYADKFLKENNLSNSKIIGMHIGASSRWPSKVWHEDNLKDFIRLAKENNYEIILFGGPNEIEKHKLISDSLAKEGIKIYRNNPLSSPLEFSALLNRCQAIICADSFAMHISIALKKPTIGLFFCTSPDEVEGYGVLKKIVSSKLYDFFPEKQDQYDEELVKSISPQEVLDALELIQS